MIPIRNRKKTLQVTVDEMRNFAFAYVEKYAPSKQQLKTYLLKKYMKLSASDVRKKDVNKLIDIVLSDLEKNRFINDQFYSESKAKSMIQRGNSINKIRNYLIGKGINEKGIDKKTGKTIIKVGKRYFRPTEVDTLLGDARKAKKILKWRPKITFNQMVKEMVERDYNDQKKLIS